MVQQAHGASDEEWAKRMEEVEKHPDAEDEKNAKAFARDMIGKV